jgi:hypothetical protein|tara:strand:- start:62 stop:430 length:369 start_codon:yes stop_codon:yes gene_type:complete
MVLLLSYLKCGAVVLQEQVAVAVCTVCLLTAEDTQLNLQQLRVETHLQFVQVDQDVVYMQVTTMQDTTVSLWEHQQVDHVFVLLLVEVVVLTVLTVMDTLVVMDVVCLVIDVNTNQTTLTLV